MPDLAAYVRKLLPASAIRRLKGMRKEWAKRQRERHRQQFIGKHGTFNSRQLITECRAAGIKENGILFVQCSYNDLLSYTGTPYELLNALRELVGPQGTLFMPTYSDNMSEVPCRPFDVLYESTYTGILPELLRREEGAVRSLHPRHSLCGLGPRAAELLAGHEDCIYADGANSPFDRISKLDAQALTLGLQPAYNSFLHWTEDVEPEKYPVPVHEGPYDCVLRDADGKEIRRPFYRRPEGHINQVWLMAKSLSPDAMRVRQFHGVTLCLYTWPALATELLALRDRGIYVFVPKGHPAAVVK